MQGERPYIIEILTPRSGAGGLTGTPGKFGIKFRKIAESGCVASIPDNPLGNPRVQALQAVESLGLHIDPEGLIMNLNTFHAKEDLDGILRKAVGAGVRYLLVVRGDGSPTLPKLRPGDVGSGSRMVTSIELLAYIHREYPGRFVTGVAFNQYKPASVELSKLRRKIDAGAGFIVTQPVLGKDHAVEALSEFSLPVAVEAWMSKNVDLMLKSVKVEKLHRNFSAYDPIDNLKVLHRAFPGSTVYLSMLDFDADWRTILPRLGGNDPRS